MFRIFLISCIHGSVFAQLFLNCASAGDAHLGSVDGILLLRNGNVIEGRILRSGDAYLISLASGARVRLPVNQVAFQGQDINEIYLRQEDSIAPGDVRQHLRLARWCLRMRLLTRGKEQLHVLRELVADHPELRRLEKQFDHVQRQVEQSRLDGDSPVPTQSRDVIEPFSIELPVGTIEEFTHVIQPLLLNSCSAATCHGIRSRTTFQLRRNPWGGGMTRPFTLRNLQASLAQVNGEEVESSKLMEYAMQAHGSDRKTTWNGPNERQLVQLKDWIIYATGKAIQQPQAFQRPPLRLAQESQTNTAELAEQKEGTENLRFTEFFDVGSAAETGRTVYPSPESTLPVEVPPRSSDDPFDPRLFNQRYHGTQ